MAQGPKRRTHNPEQTRKRSLNADTRSKQEFKTNRLLLLKDKPLCHWCNTRQATTADHLIEVDRWPTDTPGVNGLDNLVAACKSCNSSRGARYGNLKRKSIYELAPTINANTKRIYTNDCITIQNENEKELENININISINFELGMLGCDNAIADRLIKFGYKVINQPDTFKLLHYDIARGKNSSNFLEKHVNETLDKHNNNKPQNKHPERKGCYLVPNYDALLGLTQNIDLNKIINSIGGISNLEKYKIISEIYSSRIIINNPDDS